MRILQVRFKNLNSLVGEWQIDFTHPAYASDGIFAITGPTGAGKSTILDALCLALYGRTPRLARIGKSGNEIMSRQTGECLAEVTFETAKGRFRCHWSQHRARKRVGGELQMHKHEMVDATSNAVLESNVKGVAKQIEDATGMDFDRFTRSMLLAQGGFAAFLQADADDRAPILEQITGTEIYSKISIRVHELQRDEQAKLDKLKAETAGIVLLTPEQELALAAELAAGKQELVELEAALAEITRGVAWHDGMEALRKELAAVADETAALQQERDAFAPERDRLKRGECAAQLKPAFRLLTETGKELHALNGRCQTDEASLVTLKAAAEAQTQTLAAAEMRAAQAREALVAAAPILQQARLLDQKLLDQRRELTALALECRNDAGQIAAAEKERQAESARQEAADKRRQEADAYLQENARDAWLVANLTGVQEQLKALRDRHDEIGKRDREFSEAAQALSKATAALGAARKKTQQRQQEVVAAEAQQRQKKEALEGLLAGRPLCEYRSEKDHLLTERVLRATIAELAAHRAQLEDGKPCPLCGATEHPYAIGNVPVPGEIEKKIKGLEQLIQQADDLERAGKKLVEAENRARQLLAEAEKDEATAAHGEKSATQNRDRLQAALTDAQRDFALGRQRLAGALQPLGVTEIPENTLSALLESLRQRQEQWQAQMKAQADAGVELNAIAQAIARLEAAAETRRQSLEAKQGRLHALSAKLAEKVAERQCRYGDKNPDLVEKSLSQAADAAEKAEKAARDRNQTLQQDYRSAAARLDALCQQIAALHKKLQELQTDFTVQLAAKEFVDQAAFAQALLSDQELAGLAATARALGERETALKARQQDRATRLKAEIDRQVTDRTAPDLAEARQAAETTLGELRERTAHLTVQRQGNEKARELIKEKQKGIDGQRQECRRWENLHELIGSADGKKYRNFAQGLTFEMMIAHANQQLQKMSDRYLLTRDKDQPLELSVVDNYQAGEIRSTKNLSGGESFIVSLALALGLSQMASNNVRVDSLFLDEGFGTLDEEALDTALETLASLQQEGKLIGIISHVSALKERIGTQILVTPHSGGRSRISGPGCKNV